jgi:Plasmid pRiA4b ORF-3-like protein
VISRTFIPLQSCMTRSILLGVGDKDSWSKIRELPPAFLYLLLALQTASLLSVPFVATIMASTTATPANQAVYQLKITLQYSRPPIWRRVQVLGDATLAELHSTIQAVMGWNNSHLHQFTIDGEDYGHDPYSDVLNEEDYTLHQLARGALVKFTYEYDFGDGWTHDIAVEKLLPREVNQHYPVCLTGKLAGPVDDCGGIGGFYEMVEKVQNPNHPGHAEVREWLGRVGADPNFDPNRFDVDAVNALLREL